MSIDRCHSCNTPVDTDKSDDCYETGVCLCKRCTATSPTYAALSCEVDKLRLALTLALDALEETGGFKSQIASIRKAFGAPALVRVGDHDAERCAASYSDEITPERAAQIQNVVATEFEDSNRQAVETES